MAKAIPKWVQERLSKIWRESEQEDLTYEQIEKLLKPDEKTTISVFLNELRSAGWLDVKINEKDARKRIYNIKEPNKILMKISK